MEYQEPILLYRDSEWQKQNKKDKKKRAPATSSPLSGKTQNKKRQIEYQEPVLRCHDCPRVDPPYVCVCVCVCLCLCLCLCLCVCVCVCIYVCMSAREYVL